MLARKVAVGATLLGLAQLVVKGLDLALIAVAARLLTPADFGLVALAAGVMLVLNSLSDLPVADALVQRPTLSEQDLAAAFTLTAARGVLIAALLGALSAPIAWVYGDPRLIFIMLALAVAPLLQGLSSPALVRFTREVQYLPAALMQAVAKVASFAIAVTLAVLTGSYWALVAGMVATPAVTVGLSWILAPWHPRVQVSGTRDILSFAGWVTASRAIWTMNQYSDRFFVGGILGKAPLGQYTVGSEIASTGTYVMLGPLTGTLFAGFSRIRHDTDRLRSAYLRGQQVIVAATLPLGVGLAVLAEPVVELVLTPAWRDAIPVIAWLAPVIAVQSMTVGVQSAALSLAKPRALVVREAIAFALRLPLTILAAWLFGLIGAAVARALTGLIIILVNLQIAKRLLEIGVVKQFVNCRRSFVSAGVMSIAAVSLRCSMAEAGPGLLLMIVAPFGAFIYLISHFVLWHMSGHPEGAETFALRSGAELFRRFASIF